MHFWSPNKKPTGGEEEEEGEGASKGTGEDVRELPHSSGPTHE